MRQRNILFTFLSLITAVLIIGCGQANNVEVADYNAMRAQLEEKEKEVSTLKSEVVENKQKVTTLEEELATKEEALKDLQDKSTDNTVNASLNNTIGMLPSDAHSGECYARLYYPATYKTVVDTVLKSESSELIEVEPATYTWVEEKVLVKEESKQLKEIPATYETVEEKVLVQEAHTEWKKGRGLVEKVNEATGEIMCLVDIPAKYKTVSKQVVKTPARTETIVIPAEYETVKVRKMLTPPQEKRVSVPSEYQTVTRTVKVSDSYMEWKRVLCETNLERTTVKKIQSALAAHKHNPGPIDGVIGPLTHNAIKSFQESNNLATGGLTYETLEKLGVQP